jgi:hypothetical protein
VRTQRKTPSLDNIFIVGHCRGNVFTEPLSSNVRLLWLHYSDLQASCHIMLDTVHCLEYVWCTQCRELGQFPSSCVNKGRKDPTKLDLLERSSLDQWTLIIRSQVVINIDFLSGFNIGNLKVGFKVGKAESVASGPLQNRNRTHRFYWDIYFSTVMGSCLVFLVVIINKKNNNCHKLNLLHPGPPQL